jgi:hypothetical protein
MAARATEESHNPWTGEDAVLFVKEQGYLFRHAFRLQSATSPGCACVRDYTCHQHKLMKQEQSGSRSREGREHTFKASLSTLMKGPSGSPLRDFGW